jgi:hypothetical protein
MLKTSDGECVGSQSQNSKCRPEGQREAGSDVRPQMGRCGGRGQISGPEMRYSRSWSQVSSLNPVPGPERQDVEVGWREVSGTADAAQIMEGTSLRQRQRAIKKVGFLCSCLTSHFSFFLFEFWFWSLVKKLPCIYIPIVIGWTGLDLEVQEADKCVFWAYDWLR